MASSFIDDYGTIFVILMWESSEEKVKGFQVMARLID